MKKIIRRIVCIKMLIAVGGLVAVLKSANVPPVAIVCVSILLVMAIAFWFLIVTPAADSCDNEKKKISKRSE